MEDTLRRYEDEVVAGRKVAGLLDARVKSLRGRKETLEEDLEQIAFTREQRTFDGQIEGVISTILGTFSTQITGFQSSGMTGRALMQEISRATDEARDSFLSLKSDLED